MSQKALLLSLSPSSFAAFNKFYDNNNNINDDDDNDNNNAFWLMTNENPAWSGTKRQSNSPCPVTRKSPWQQSLNPQNLCIWSNHHCRQAHAGYLRLA